MEIHPAPDSCPKCQGTHLVRLLWDYFIWDDEINDDLAAGAYLALHHRYLTSAIPTLVVGNLVAKRSRLPRWACLDCFPQWADLHRLALKEREVELAKDAAVEASDFETAAALQGELGRLKATHSPEYERLLRELVAQDSPSS